MLKHWTAYNRLLDLHIDNNRDTVFQDGTVVPEKQSVSQVLKQKVDLYAERKKQVTADEAVRNNTAMTRAAKP